MKYVALLRGINVGGNNKVDMKTLKISFDSLGLADVVTYINSGNIIFSDERSKVDELVSIIETVIQRDFNLDIKVLLRSKSQLDEVMKALPKDWVNDSSMKSDALFLWDEVNSQNVLEELTIKDGIDTVIYVSGVVLWSIDRFNQGKSGMQKLVGTNLYKQMTIRNVNTLRKIYDLMQG